MESYKKGYDFTGYYLVKCPCGNFIRVNVGKYALRGFASDGKHTLDLHGLKVKCPDCGKEVLVTYYGKPLYGKFKQEVICNSKCTQATGHNCECSCGGRNHGSGNQITQLNIK